MCASLALCGTRFLSLAESVTLHPVADTEISAQSPASNFGSGGDMVIGTQGPTAGTPKNRGLIRFDFNGQIPPGSQIKSVALTLTVAKVPLGGVNSIFELRRVLRTWNECQATWNIRAGVTEFWSAPGAVAPTDFSSGISATQFVAGLSSYSFGSTTNLVADVQAWLDNPQTNFGWIVLTQREDLGKTARRFASREGGAAGPSLIVEYTVSQAQPPRLSQTTLLGDQVTFQFGAEAQRAYVVEFNDTMGSTNWLTLTNIIAQPGPTNITVFDSASASQRFYRVKSP